MSRFAPPPSFLSVRLILQSDPINSAHRSSRMENGSLPRVDIIVVSWNCGGDIRTTWATVGVHRRMFPRATYISFAPGLPSHPSLNSQRPFGLDRRGTNGMKPLPMAKRRRRERCPARLGGHPRRGISRDRTCCPQISRFRRS